MGAAAFARHAVQLHGLQQGLPGTGGAVAENIREFPNSTASAPRAGMANMAAIPEPQRRTLPATAFHAPSKHTSDGRDMNAAKQWPRRFEQRRPFGAKLLAAIFKINETGCGHRRCRARSY